MAFLVPTPVPSKGIRRDVATSMAYYKSVEEKFRPTVDLSCSICLKKGQIMEAYGFCKICKDFLCRKCVEKHESTLLTLNHGVITGNDMMERYHHAMRKDKKKGRSVSRSHLDMIADGRTSFQYGGDEKIEMAESVKEPKIRLGTDQRKCFICACVVYDDGKVVLADANNKCLKLFSKHFDFLFNFHMKHEPWDICRAINKDEDLFVTETSIQGIHQFKVKKDIQYVFTVKVNGECYGITSWKGGVAVSVKDRGNFNVQLLDQFGNIHRVIHDGFEMKVNFISPWYLASINNGKELLISDAGAGSVFCVNVEDGVKFIYKNRKTFQDPRNITCDENDNIFVIEYASDTVHRLKKSGEADGIVLTAKDGLNNPSALCYDNGLIYTQAKMDSNYLQVYKIMSNKD